MCYEREKGKIKGRGDDPKGGGRRGGNSSEDFEKAMGQHYFISLLKHTYHTPIKCNCI